MADLIDRQEAIDALWKALYEYEDKTEKQFKESDELDVGDWILHRVFVQNMSDIDRRAILDLPSAQPEPCGDVVSRNAIVQKLNEMDRYVSTELRLCDTDKKFPQNEVFIVDDVYEEIVEQLPSVQPETAKFIRWMECKKTAEYISYTPHCKCSKCGTEFLITTIKYCYMCGAKMEENNEAD